jgi:hypothetical protein
MIVPLNTYSLQLGAKHKHANRKKVRGKKYVLPINRTGRRSQAFFETHPISSTIDAEF